MTVKNLSQLKKALTPGTTFEIVHHSTDRYKPQEGMERIVTQSGATVIYTKLVMPKNPTQAQIEAHNFCNTANDGKGLYLNFGNAKCWKFNDDGTIIYYDEYLIKKGIFEEIMTIRLTGEKKQKQLDFLSIVKSYSLGNLKKWLNDNLRPGSYDFFIDRTEWMKAETANSFGFITKSDYTDGTITDYLTPTEFIFSVLFPAVQENKAISLNLYA